MSDIPTRVRTAIAELFGLVPGGFADDSHMIDDLGADSLDTVELVLELEARFGIEIPDAEMSTLGTVAEAIALVQRLTEASAAAA